MPERYLVRWFEKRAAALIRTARSTQDSEAALRLYSRASLFLTAAERLSRRPA